jgi:hypothetical protein
MMRILWLLVLVALLFTGFWWWDSRSNQAEETITVETSLPEEVAPVPVEVIVPDWDKYEFAETKIETNDATVIDVVVTRTQGAKSLQIVDFADKGELKILLDEDDDKNQVLATLPYAEPSDVDGTSLIFTDESFAIVDYLVAEVPGQIFLDFVNQEVIQVDYAQFVVGSTGADLVSFGVGEAVQGLILHKVGGELVDKFITDKKVQDVKVSGGILEFLEVDGVLSEKKTINLAAYAEFLQSQ